MITDDVGKCFALLPSMGFIYDIVGYLVSELFLPIHIDDIDNIVQIILKKYNIINVSRSSWWGINDCLDIDNNENLISVIEHNHIFNNLIYTGNTLKDGISYTIFTNLSYLKILFIIFIILKIPMETRQILTINHPSWFTNFINHHIHITNSAILYDNLETSLGPEFIYNFFDVNEDYNKNIVQLKTIRQAPVSYCRICHANERIL